MTDMTAAEKGALLLAEPEVTLRRIPIARDGWAYDADCHDDPAYEITFNMIDGEADLASVRMDKFE